MPKHTIEFELPSEREELNTVMHASEYYSALWEIDQYCRGILKHGNGKENLEKTPEHIRSLACVVYTE